MTNAGADKPNERIFLSLATVTRVEEQIVVCAPHSGWVAPLGPEASAFRTEIVRRCGVNHALTLSSGTADLRLALLALGIGEGDYIPASTVTFAVTTNAIAYVGAIPAFVDVAENGNVDPGLLLRTVDELFAEGKNVPGVIIVDFFDRCADYPASAPRLGRLDITLIGDTVEALGASVDGQPAGSFSHAAALSFNGNKIMTTSSGGVPLSDDADLIARARYLFAQARQPVAWCEHTGIDYNYRLSSLLAALGRAQHLRLDDMITRHCQVHDVYIDLLALLGGDTPNKDTRLLSGSDERFTENCWLVSIVPPRETVDKGMLSPDDVITALGEVNIEAHHLWKPMHLQPVYEGARANINNTAENLLSRGITLPSDPVLDDGDVARVIGVLREVLG